jgi:hypothetical protein
MSSSIPFRPKRYELLDRTVDMHLTQSTYRLSETAPNGERLPMQGGQGMQRTLKGVKDIDIFERETNPASEI